MKNTQYQQTKQAARAFRSEALAALDAAGGEFADFKAAVDKRVVIDEGALTLALAGEYSVGKSSLIKALTGQDVPVGAGVTTAAVHEYKYEDLVLVDMPGTLSGQMEHDEIAKRAITDADLILFVVSNELFNHESLPYFKVAAVQLAKKHQMLLVVNKFDRFNLAGRTADEAAQFIAGVLAEEIQPLAINDFGPVVVSTRDYLAAKDTNDAAKRVRQLAASRFDVLVTTIDEFCAKRGVLAQQLRPLQQLLEVLDDAIAHALADDGSRSRAEALVRRRIFAFTEARSLARIELRKLREDARGRFVQPAEKLLKLLDNRASQEEMDAASTSVENELEHVVKSVGEALAALHERLTADIQERLDEIDASTLAQQVRAEFEVNLDRPDVSGIGGGMSPKARKAVTDSLKSASKYAAKNSKKVADALAGVFKFFGGKFKPWGKIKLGKWVKTGGKVLGPLVVLAEAYMNYREEEQKEKAEQKLRTLRAELRAQFADAANQFDAALREQEDLLVSLLYDEPLAAASALAHEIVAGDEEKTTLAEQLSKLTQRIRKQIDSSGAHR